MPLALTVFHSWKAKSKSSVSVAARGNKTAETTGYGSDHLPIYDLEPKLAEFKDHFNYTMKRYLDQKLLIEKHEGGLEEFSKGKLLFMHSKCSHHERACLYQYKRYLALCFWPSMCCRLFEVWDQHGTWCNCIPGMGPCSTVSSSIAMQLLVNGPRLTYN